MGNDILQNSASFISNETQEFLNAQIFAMPNWKWIGLAASIFLVLVINKFTRILLFKLKKKLHIENDRTFFSYFMQQKVEKGLSWIFAAMIGMALCESLVLPANLEKYLLLFLKIIIGIHSLRLAYFAADASGLLIDHWASQKKITDR